MHRPARPVTAYDEDLHELVADLVATMYAANGVGLAACQVGVDLAVFVFDCPDKDGVVHRGVVCNPVVELPAGRERRLDEADEGCLSYPGAFVECARPDYALVTGQDADGHDVRYEGDGLLAKCLQHETDHTQGRVFGDRINDRARKRLRKQMESNAEFYPPDWPVGFEPGADPEEL
jgi:peptide deformylase